MNATARELLAQATVVLGGGSDARRDAELLLLHATSQPRAWLYAHGEEPVDAAPAARFRERVARRAAGEPLAYVVGHREFWSLDLVVTPAVLIPRTETELLVELALQRVRIGASADIADLGTGSGAVALALAHECPRWRVVASDISAAALDTARGNAQRLRIGNIEFAQGDWCDALGSLRFDLIVSNPPYIADGDAHLRQGDLRFEPLGALTSGPEGLDAIDSIVRGAPTHLKPGGWLLLEHGFDQGRAIRERLEKSGFVEVFTAADLERRERVSGARRPI